MSRIKNFYHIDLYRIKSQSEVHGLGLEEIVADKESIIAIEWPEKIEELSKKWTIYLNFSYCDDGARQIRVQAPLRISQELRV